MQRSTSPDFLVVDDDPINNIIFKKVIQKTFPESEISTFTDAESVLNHVDSTYNTADANEAVWFVDINMPVLNGWELLKRFSGFSKEARERFRIYILSSSIDESDVQKAASDPLITGYIVKPLSVMKIQSLLNDLGELA